MVLGLVPWQDLAPVGMLENYCHLQLQLALSGWLAWGQEQSPFLSFCFTFQRPQGLGGAKV